MDWSTVWTTATDPYLLLRVAVYVLLAKVAVAALSAALRREFDWRKLADFLEADVALKGAGLLVLFLLGILDKAAMPAFQAAAAAFTAAEARKLFAHLFE